MGFSFVKDVKDLPLDVDSFLARDPQLNNITLGVLERMRRGVLDIKDYALFVVRNEQKEVIQYGHFMAPHPLCLSQGTAVEALKVGVQKQGFPYSGIQGTKEQVEIFLRAGRADDVEETERQGFYRLTKVIEPAPTGGMFRAAVEADVEVLQVWSEAFSKECGLPVGTPDERRMHMRRKIEATHTFVLEKDGEVVSMVSIGRLLPGGASIGLVYTPKELRGKGYAGELTAKVSRVILDMPGNSFAVLFTQLDNATSNKIYQNIGFEWVCEYLHVKLKDK